MIGYVCIGTNDPVVAAKFYDPVLTLLGAKRTWETERYIGWGSTPERTNLLLIKPLDGKPASVGNGSMVSFAADSKATVDAIYKQALALGGKDEGPAGARGDNFYAAYFRDLEGNKLAVYYSS